MTDKKRLEKDLKNYNMYKIAVENLKENIRFLDETETGVGAVDFDKISTSPTNSISDIIHDTVIAKSEKIYYIEREIERLTLKIESIDRALGGLNELEKGVIKGFYISDLPWWQVSSQVGYSEQHCKLKRTEALEKMLIGLYGSK